MPEDSQEPFSKDALLPAPQPLLSREHVSLLWYSKDQSLDFEGSECLRQVHL